MILWASAFQPLIKVVRGTALGIGYEYIYLFGRIEPHFKTDFGSYLALSAWKRMIFHLSGTLGSALGAALVAVIADERLWIITRKAHRAEANSAKCVLLHSPLPFERLLRYKERANRSWSFTSGTAIQIKHQREVVILCG
jgi:hypothetical protein